MPSPARADALPPSWLTRAVTITTRYAKHTMALMHSQVADDDCSSGLHGRWAPMPYHLSSLSAATFILRLLFGRHARLAPDQFRERIGTAATMLTVFRALLTSSLFIAAIVNDSRVLLVVALSLSMLLDTVDGHVARARHAETVFGAQIDGLADRLAATFVFVGVASMHTDTLTLIVGSVIWIQFGVIDQFLSNQFLRFGLWSPDHFYAVDEVAWRWNWSPYAKAASNAPIWMFAIGSWGVWVALIFSLSLIAIRVRQYPVISRQSLSLIQEYGLAQVKPPRSLVDAALSSMASTPR
jgi:hypothetical protein